MNAKPLRPIKAEQSKKLARHFNQKSQDANRPDP